MNSEQNSSEQTAGADEIVTGLAEMINAALGVGASFAKLVAQAMSGNRPLPAPPGVGNPLSELVHYSVTIITNVIGLVVLGASGAGGKVSVDPKGGQASPTRPAPRTAAGATASGRPVVHQGSTLRMPLSIENPLGEPMTGLRFVCLGLRAAATGQGSILDKMAVRFQPEALTIAAKDFEKLTVFVDTRADTAPGQYEATIALEQGGFEAVLQFEVALAQDVAV